MESFFKTLSKLESVILVDEETEYLAETKAALYEVIRYVESGQFSSSITNKFIAREFRITRISDLTNKYNSLYCTDKTESAMRSQVSTASTQLYQLFGTNISDVFITQDLKRIETILDIIDMLDGYPRGANDYLIQEILEETTTRNTSYELCELKDTIKMLRPLLKRSVDNILEEVDKDKLGYILYILSSPLTSNKRRSVNNEKLEILQEFSRNSYECSCELVSMLEKLSDKENGYKDSESNRNALLKFLIRHSNKGLQELIDTKKISSNDIKETLKVFRRLD